MLLLLKAMKVPVVARHRLQQQEPELYRLLRWLPFTNTCLTRITVTMNGTHHGTPMTNTARYLDVAKRKYVNLRTVKRCMTRSTVRWGWTAGRKSSWENGCRQGTCPSQPFLKNRHGNIGTVTVSSSIMRQLPMCTNWPSDTWQDSIIDKVGKNDVPRKNRNDSTSPYPLLDAHKWNLVNGQRLLCGQPFLQRKREVDFITYTKISNCAYRQIKLIPRESKIYIPVIRTTSLHHQFQGTATPLVLKLVVYDH